MAAKSSDEKKSHMVTIRMDRPMKASLNEAAEATGRSLSGEIQHRLANYESMRDFFDRLFDDSMVIDVAVGLKTLRKGAETTPPSSISDEETISLERAVVTAACIAKLFETVAEHAGHALTAKRETMLTEEWSQKIETGDLADDFDIPAMAAKFSAALTNFATQDGERMARYMGTTIGPSMWDVCFDKDDPFRSALVGTGNVLAELWTRVSLPPSFMPPPQTDENRWLAFVAKMKGSKEIRVAAKHQIGKALYPGKSEDEVMDIIFNELMTFEIGVSGAAADATEG